MRDGVLLAAEAGVVYFCQLFCSRPHTFAVFVPTVAFYGSLSFANGPTLQHLLFSCLRMLVLPWVGSGVVRPVLGLCSVGSLNWRFVGLLKEQRMRVEKEGRMKGATRSRRYACWCEEYESGAV